MIDRSNIVFKDLPVKEVTAKIAKLSPDSALSSRFHKCLSSQSFWPSVRTEGAVGREDSEWKLGLLTGSYALLICLQNCWTPPAPDTSTAQKIKNKSHPFCSCELVSHSSIGWLSCSLRSESAKFCFGAPVCSLHVSGHWGSVGLARNVTSSVLCIPFLSGSVFPSLLLLKIGNHIG